MKIVIEQMPDEWDGTIDLESTFKSDCFYVTSKSESLCEAIKDILNRYDDKKIRAISLKRVKKQS